MIKDNTTGLLTSNYLEVIHKITIKINDSTQKSTSSYAIFIKKETQKNMI
jgi:hypothetical protein